MAAMKIQTVATTVSAPHDEVFRFLASVENLPRWATEFCQRVERRHGRWIAHTAQGELRFAIAADVHTGVIDLYAGATPETMAFFPLRVMPLPEGTTAITFTFFQPPGMPDEVYDRQHESLVGEMRALAARFGGGETHATPGVCAAA
jgi:hypothetical protein